MDPQLNMFGTSDTLRDAQERVDRVKRDKGDRMSVLRSILQAVPSKAV